MSEEKKTKLGSISWRDLTVENAEEVKDFYSKVVGWDSANHDMGGYNDFMMNKSGTNDTVAGICHARGSNANVPAQWLIYITVEDVEASAKLCVENGGEIVDGPREMGEHKFCVIKDPSGAVAGLYQG
ncbi:MAG: VOC family protein [Planctomycetota bacterium]|nr:VOC family protein [Planctomycetota bacterium]